MGPNTKILTKRDRALIWTPLDSSRKNKQFKIKKVKIGCKIIELCQLMSRLKSGIWPILGLKARGGGVNVIFSVFTYVTELLKTNK